MSIKNIGTYHLKWNELTQKWVVIYDTTLPDYSANAMLSKASVVSAMVLGLSSTSAYATSVYQQKSALERQNIGGQGVTVAYLDTGTDLNNSAFPLRAYQKQLTGLAINTAAKHGSNERLYYTNAVKSSASSQHGTWMTHTILQQAPDTNVVVGMFSGSDFNGHLRDYYDAMAKLSDANGKNVKIIGTSIGFTNGQGSLVPFSGYQKQYDTIKNNDALVIATTGNRWSNTLAYAPLIEYSASAKKDEALKYTGRHYGHWINVTGLNQTRTDAASDVMHCQTSMYYCVAAEQGPAHRDANGQLIRNAKGQIQYGDYYGTSWAAPNVTAIAGLVQQRYPWMSAQNIFEVVLGTATDIGAKGIDEQSGWGAVNRDAAIGGYGQFAWGQSELNVPQNQVAYFDNDIGDDRSVNGKAGGFDKLGHGTLVLNGHNTYRGDSNIQSGTVVVNGRNVHSTFNVNSNANLVVGDVEAAVKNLNNAGRVSLAYLNSQLDVGHYHGAVGSSLDVYAHLSKAHQVQMGSVNIRGNSSGESTVYVRQAGGANGLIANRQAQADGYLLIAVQGNSQAQFKQAGRITAGAYEYQLKRGQNNPNNWYLQTGVQKTTPVKTNEVVAAVQKPVAQIPQQTLQKPDVQKQVAKNESLVTSTFETVFVETAVTKPVAAKPTVEKSQNEAPVSITVQKNDTSAQTQAVLSRVDVVEADVNVEDLAILVGQDGQLKNPNQIALHSAVPTVAVPVYRPEAATVIGHQVATHQLFDMHALGAQRQFQHNAINALGNQQDVWVAYRRDDERYRVGGEQIDLDATYDAVQLGVTVLGSERFKAGVTAAYGRYDSNSQSRISGYQSQGQTEAYAVGVYADYEQNPNANAGFKAQSQVLWNHFEHEISGEQAPRVSYDADGVSLQAKISYGFEQETANGARYSIQPQAMFDYHNVKADRVELHDGTVIDTNNDAMWRAGVGVKVQADVAVGQNSRIKPYAEVNWYHQNRDLSVNMDKNQVSFHGTSQILETKVGVSAQIGSQTEVWGAAGMQWGDSSYRKASGQVGIRYRF